MPSFWGEPMRNLIHVMALSGTMAAMLPASSEAVLAQGFSHRPSDYSNGYGTNAANSAAAGRPVGPFGGYVVNQYGFGNYVSGPAGYGGYPAGSAGAQIWRQREQWKCENVPESC